MAGSGPYGNSAFAHSLVGFYPDFLSGELRFQFVRNVGGNQLYGCVRFQHVYAVLRQCQGKLTLVGLILEGDVGNAILTHEPASHVFFRAHINIPPELGPAFFQVVGPVSVAVDADGGAMPMRNALAVAQVLFQAVNVVVVGAFDDFFAQVDVDGDDIAGQNGFQPPAVGAGTTGQSIFGPVATGGGGDQGGGGFGFDPSQGGRPAQSSGQNLFGSATNDSRSR